MMKRAMGVLLVAVMVLGAEAPRVEITNGEIRAAIYLPDGRNGYYRGTRFDWSGVISSLTYKGHNYYGEWFTKTDPAVHDFIYSGNEIVAGPCSAITGPVDEFRPVGFEEAKVGGRFLKIGVGGLRKPDDGKYDNYRVYEIAVPGKWTVNKSGSAVEFVQELNDPGSGYGYEYRKTVKLTEGKAEMVLSHSLKNTGKKGIETSVYNHNFLVLDGQATGPAFTISVPFAIEAGRPVNPELAEVRGKRVVYLKTLKDRDVVSTRVKGFGATAKDHEIRIENRKAGVGMVIQGDRALESENLWSIRSVIAMEPFIRVSVAQGETFTWTNRYLHYTVGGSSQ